MDASGIGTISEYNYDQHQSKQFSPETGNAKTINIYVCQTVCQFLQTVSVRVDMFS